MGEVQGSPAPPWSDLPSELLGLVFLRLPTRADRAFFPAVCRAWCSAARQCHLPLPSPVPWLLLPGGSATSFPRGETFQLRDGVTYHNSFGEWLLLSDSGYGYFLTNPFTKATMPLPSLYSYSYYQEAVDLDYMLENDMLGTWWSGMYHDDISVVSLVVCSTRLIAAIIAVGGLGTIALCRPGAAAWSVSAYEECRWLSNMVFFQGKLYALDRNNGSEDLISIDIVDEHDSSAPRVSRIEFLIEGISLPPQQDIMQGNRCYLVESHGTLLMIRRNLQYSREHYRGRSYIIHVAGIEVFEANFEQHLWAAVRTLGNDQALFLGQGCSRAVRVSPYDLSRDCIFFLDDYIDWYSKWKRETTSCGLYDMKDEKIYLPLPMISWRSKKVPATWIFSQGQTDEAADSREDSPEIVEPEEVEPADASTTLNWAKLL